MANEVKWIKITTDIFDDEKMFAIETQQDGYLIELIWFKLLCLAGKCNNHGFLMINNKIAYTDEMLASVFRVEIGSIQRALRLFEQLEMIEVVENAYMIANWDKHQNMKGLEDYKEKHRLRQKAYRDRQKQLALEEKTESDVLRDVTVASQSDGFCSISISNSISKEDTNNNNNTNNNNKKNTKHIYGEYKHVRLTDEQYEKLLTDFGQGKLDKCIQILDEYIETSGRSYKNHNLVLRGWVQNEFKRRYPCFEQVESKPELSADEIRKRVMGEI